jgi:hypothetical protein
MGNDGGKIAIGLLPFVKVPTAASDIGNGKFEGGISTPVNLDLAEGWSLGTMMTWTKDLNQDGVNYHTGFASMFTIGHEFSEKIGGYVEFANEASNEEGAAWVATFDTGLTYDFVENARLDLGVNIGLTDAAEDLNPFLGLTVRY